MKLYSQLEVASLENLSSDPSLLPEGRIWFNTTSFDLKVRANSITTTLLRNNKAVFGSSGTAADNIKFQRSAAGKFQFLLGNDATAEGSVSAALAELDAKIANYANTGALPSAGVAGRMGFVTGTTLLYFDTGAAWSSVGDASTNTTTSVDGEVSLFSSTTGKLFKRATGTGVAHLTSGVLSVGNVVLTSEVSGVLPIASGGTNNGSLAVTAGGVLFTDGSKIVNLGAGTSGQHIISQGSGTPVWVTDDAAAEALNYTLVASVSGNALTIALKTKAGTDPSATDPVKVNFRNATNATGDYTTLLITSALSVVVSSGSTLGFANGVTHDIWVYLFNDAGTPRLGVSQTLFNTNAVLSSTAEGGAGAADSNNVIYTGTAVTSKAAIILAVLNANEATAGTWATAPSFIGLKPILKQAISAKYTNSSTALASSTAATVVYANKVVDNLNAYSTSTGKFTCPRAGRVGIKAASFIAATYIANQVEEIFIRLNSTDKEVSIRRAFASMASSSTFISTEIDVAANDTLEVRVFTEGTGPSISSSDANNFVEFTYLD